MPVIYMLSSFQHRRHKLYMSLVKRNKSIEPEFDDEVCHAVHSARHKSYFTLLR